MSLRKPEKWELYPLVYPRPRAVVIPYEAVGRRAPKEILKEEFTKAVAPALRRETDATNRTEVLEVYRDAYQQQRQEADATVARSHKIEPAKQILKRVCEAYPGITPKDLIGPRRTQALVVPRQHAMYELVMSGRSYPKVGRLLGGRDHTTVLHGVKKHARTHGLPLPQRANGSGKPVTGETDDRASSPSAPPPAPDA